MTKTKKLVLSAMFAAVMCILGPIAWIFLRGSSWNPCLLSVGKSLVYVCNGS